MPRQRKTAEEPVETVDETVEQPSLDQMETVEVEFTEEYKDHCGIIYKGTFVPFTDGKATVFASAADNLREQGFII